MTEGDRPGRRSPHREDTLRLGCVCACCDHSEGSDCACDCHENGRCSSTAMPGPQARSSQNATLTNDDIRTAYELVVRGTKYGPHTVVTRGDVILRMRPELVDEIDPSKIYYVTKSGFTEVVE